MEGPSSKGVESICRGADEGLELGRRNGEGRGASREQRGGLVTQPRG